MKGHGSKFGRKKEAAIAALLAERNLAEAARVVGIDLSTLKRWLRRPEFIEEYRRARWEVVEQAYARVQQNTERPVNRQPDAPRSVRRAQHPSVSECLCQGLRALDGTLCSSHCARKRTMNFTAVQNRTGL